MLALVFLTARSARAWIETDVLGHQATIVVEERGQAEVRHQLLLKVRGGPLETLSIDGVGEVLQTFEDAVVRRTSNSSTNVWPLGLEPREDGSLQVRIEAEKGLRGGTYQFEFGYRVALTEHGRLERHGDRARITWVGPRFSGGVDSAKVIFRLPRSAVTPSLPNGDDSQNAGVLLSQVRRSAGFDEVELVRARVARGEPAVWQIDAGVEPFAGAIDAAVVAQGPNLSPPPPRKLELPRAPRWAWGLSAALALIYSSVVLHKARAFERSANAAGAIVRPLVPLPSLPRALMAGALFGAAAGLGLLEFPTLAGACLAIAILAATLLPAARASRARGPGEWSLLGEQERRAGGAQATDGAGSFLDASSVVGFIVFVTLCVAASGVAWLLLAQSPYQAGLVVVGSTAWLPVFFTGRRTDMPPDAAFGALPLYRFVSKKLEAHGWVRSEIWARRPLGGGAPDELRLRLTLDDARPGVRAIEVGVELGAGLVTLPCVIVRVVDDSDAYRALPRGVVWMRGRTSEERVAILRPKVPSRAGCLRLVEEVLRLERAGVAPEGRYAERRSVRKSSGSGAVTAKGVTPATSHAT